MAICASVPSPKITQQRAEIASANLWNVEALYASWGAWEAEFPQEEDKWSELAALQQTWSRSPENLKSLLDTCFLIDRKLSKLYTYAHLRHDEDVGEEVAKQAYARITSLLYDFRQESAWVEPALLALPEEQLSALMHSEPLRPYLFYLEKMVRMKKHTLPAEQEELLAMAGKPLEAAHQAFGAFNNADLKFSPAQDSQGALHELTHGKYQLYLRSQDRALRESAFKNVHRGFLAYENTLCELLSGQVSRHLFELRARHFASALDAALYPNQIDTSVYTSLIEAVRSHLPALHRYMQLRKKVLGVETLHLYDLHVPLVKEVEEHMPYEEAVKLIVESLLPLGKAYQQQVAAGLGPQRWVDRYENVRKRSGAYSSGCYDSMPYILMNYHGTTNDLRTLTHEVGHSMHSFLSREHQPYHYSQYSIFVAEVASTFHEELLSRYLLAKAKTKELKVALITQKIDDMRSTLLRQTLFAEFELKMHTYAQQGIPLTPALLKKEYRTLNEEYFGPGVCIDAEADIEWARIPHFYSCFYVYQYATGISAAHALAERVLSGGDKERQDYLSFLGAGASLYPIDVLKLAGVDMRKRAPVEAAMRHFDALVSQLEALLQ